MMCPGYFSNTTKFLFYLVLGLLAVLGLVVAVIAQPPPVLEYIWTAPTSGSPVEHYIVEVNKNGVLYPPLCGSTADSVPAFTMEISFGDLYQIRVAGVDSLDRTGIFSEWSDLHSVEIPLPGPPPPPPPPIK